VDHEQCAEATLILVETAERLRALGLHFSISRTAEMPQGEVLSLHVATTSVAAVAGCVALGHGSRAATSRNTRAAFAEVVAESVASGLVDTIPD